MSEVLTSNIYLKKAKDLNFSTLCNLYFLNVKEHSDIFNDNLLRPLEQISEYSIPKPENQKEGFDNIENLKLYEKGRKIEYVFFTEYTNLFVLLDCSPSMLKFDVNSTKIHLELMEDMIINFFKNLNHCLKQIKNNQFKIFPRINVFAFGLPVTNFLHLVGDFILEDNTIDLLLQKLKKAIQAMYEKISAETPVYSGIKEEKKKSIGFEPFFELLIGYMSKNYSDQNTLSKLVLFTDGICIENTTSVYDALDLNKFFMACDIILTGLPESCISNDFGFIFSKPLLKSLAKILNGKIYTNQDFEKLCQYSMLAMDGDQLPSIPEFLRVALGVPQHIKYMDPPTKQMQEQVKKDTIKPYKKIRIKYHEHPATQIKNFEDVLNNRLISFWKLCYINRADGFEREMTIRIKFAPEVDMMLFLLLRTNEKKIVHLNRIIIYIRGPTYLLQKLDDITQKNVLQFKLNQAKEKEKRENVMPDMIPTIITLKYDEQTKNYDLNFSTHAKRVLNILNHNQSWHKFFKLERISFVFRRKFDAVQRKWTAGSEVKKMMTEATNKALSRTLYLKILVDGDPTKLGKVIPLEKFLLIKYKWLTKEIIGFKVGLYSSTKLEYH